MKRSLKCWEHLSLLDKGVLLNSTATLILTVIFKLQSVGGEPTEWKQLYQKNHIKIHKTAGKGLKKIALLVRQKNLDGKAVTN